MVILEQKPRRIELALFVLSHALRSTWRTLVEMGVVRNVPHANVWLFVISMGVIMHSYISHPSLLRRTYLSMFRWFFGSAGNEIGHSQYMKIESHHDSDHSNHSPHTQSELAITSAPASALTTTALPTANADAAASVCAAIPLLPAAASSLSSSAASTSALVPPTAAVTAATASLSTSAASASSLETSVLLTSSTAAAMAIAAAAGVAPGTGKLDAVPAQSASSSTSTRASKLKKLPSAIEEETGASDEQD